MHSPYHPSYPPEPGIVWIDIRPERQANENSQNMFYCVPICNRHHRLRSRLQPTRLHSKEPRYPPRQRSITKIPASPTLPPTLTPLPPTPQATASLSTAYQSVPLSAADDSAYQQALQDIPVYRQGDFHLVVQDSLGNPLPGYQVTYRQTSHDFMFGGVADPWHIMKLGPAGINTIIGIMDWGWRRKISARNGIGFPGLLDGHGRTSSGGIRIRDRWFVRVGRRSNIRIQKHLIR